MRIKWVILLFKYSLFKYARKNRRFRAAFPEFSIPPDYYLYETYLVDYEKYQSDGLLASKEILEWTDAYCRQPLHQILEWGCGMGRIVRHLPGMLPATTMIHVCDINREIHRMMTTYNETGKFKEIISPLFRVLEFHDGKKDIAKTGGQDLWIVRKIQSS